MKTLSTLVKAGKIGGIGLCECSAEAIRRAVKIAKIDIVEVEVSLWSTEIFQNGVADACAEIGIAIATYSLLGKGFLTGKLVKQDEIAEGDHRKHMPRFQPGAFERNFKMVESLQRLAADKGTQPSQLALAWVRAQGGKAGRPAIVPIPGSSSIQRIQENLTEVTLSDSDLAKLDQLVKEHEILGARYPEAVNRLSFGDSPVLEG